MGTKSDKWKSWRMKLKKILIHKLLQIKQIAIKKMRVKSDIKKLKDEVEKKFIFINYSK
jgi:hypothetical protein